MYKQLLMLIYNLGFERTAFRVASKWAKNHKNRSKYNAAMYFSDNQTSYPHCQYCTWFIEPDGQHDHCDEQLRLEDAGWIDPSDYDDLYDDEDDFDDEADYASLTDVYNRAYAHFGGNTELTREAAEMYPGDFI